MKYFGDTNSNISSIEGTTESLRILNERNNERMKPIFEISFVELNADIINIQLIANNEGIKDSLKRFQEIVNSNEDYYLKLIKLGESIGSFLLRYGKIIVDDTDLKESVKILLINYLDTINKTNNQDLINSAINNVKSFLVA